MAHLQQFKYVDKLKSKFPDNFSNKKVLEVGSANLDGSIRFLFRNCDYLGIDVATCPGVDLVCEGQKLDHPNDTYDTVASCECFEHNPYWEETFINMHRMTKVGGLIFMTCGSTGRPEHGTTNSRPWASPLTVAKGWEYYKNLTEEDFRKNMNIDSMFSEYEFEVSPLPYHDLYFYGIKK
jgi:SAM-dependent methyltransferase